MSTGGVLAGVDGSVNSYSALDVAVAESQARDKTLRIVTAYSVPAMARGVAGAQYEELSREIAGAVLDEAAEYARTHGIEVETTLVVGDASGALIEQTRGADLAVVGARGKGGFPGRLVGSVAAALPAHAKCAVIVVPSVDAALHSESKAAVDYSGRIVVGIDSEGVSSSALSAAADSARYHDKPLAVVAVANVNFGGLELAPTPFEASTTHSTIQPVLDACVAKVKKSHPEIEVNARIHDGKAADLLAEISATASQVVVGSRGRGVLASVLLGSTSRELLHYARGPVMVVPE